MVEKSPSCSTFVFWRVRVYIVITFQFLVVKTNTLLNTVAAGFNLWSPSTIGMRSLKPMHWTMWGLAEAKGPLEKTYVYNIYQAFF